MRRSLTALILAALLALAAGGCGGDSDEPETTTGSGDGTAQTAPAGGDEKGSESGSESGSGDRVENGDGDGGQGSGDSGESSEDPSDPVPEAPAGGDNSIQTFGSEASGEEEEEIADAMLAFFEAMAAADGAGVCAGITDANREGIEKFLKPKGEGPKNCEELLPQILRGQKPEAQKAAEATVAEVRIDGDRALVLFRPEGEDIRYFAMIHENDEWKAINLSTGTPLEAMPAGG